MQFALSQTQNIILIPTQYLNLNSCLHLMIYLKFNAAKFIKKKLKGQIPQYFMNQIFTADQIHNYNTRQNNDIRPPNISSILQEQLLSVKVAEVWNNLPDHIKVCAYMSSNTFTRKCQSFPRYLHNIMQSSKLLYL